MQSSRLGSSNNIYSSTKDPAGPGAAWRGFINMQKGNTVLEMMVALTVLTTGLIAVIGLSFGNVLQTRTSLNEVQASNFAREGVEIVRNIRDSNKYKKTPPPPARWNAGVNTAEGVEQSIDTVSRSLVPTSSTNTTIYQGSDTLYAQASASGTNTKFQRTVTLYPICSTGSPQTDDFGSASGSSCDFNSTDTGIGSTIGIQVLSTVTWQEESRARQIVVEDRLYNW